MPDDQHPADGLIDDIRGLFNGQTFIKGIRDAYDRHFGKPQPAQSSDPNKDPYVRQEQADALKSFQDAAQKNLTAAAAAKIRAKANQRLGE